MTHAHHTAVSDIARYVKAFYESKTPFRVYHGSTSSTRPVRFDKDKIIDISGLNRTLSIDKEKRVTLVEPKVSMSGLVTECLKHGLIPAVVPEFPGITVGGAFAGTAAESSSFRYGYFDKTVNWIEVVLGNSNIVKVSPTENAELFYSSAGAMGTLGIVTLLEVQLVPCHKYIRVEYHAVTSQQKATSLLGVLQITAIDFLDGLMFSSNMGMLMTGKLLSAADQETERHFPIVQFTRGKYPWFSTHVHAKLHCPPDLACLTCRWTKYSFTASQTPRNRNLIELVPVRDYLFRYERGSFWLGAYGWAPPMLNRVTRRVLNSVFTSEFSTRLQQQSGTAQHCIMQDLAIPEARAVELLHFLEARLRIYPLWLCPIASSSSSNGSINEAIMRAPRSQTAPPRFLINIRVWGIPNLGEDAYTKDSVDRFVDDNRAIEDKLRETGGLKWLYAQNFYNEAEFRGVYDRERYRELRSRWGAETLPSVWDKVKREPQAWKDVKLAKATFGALVGRGGFMKS